MATVLVVDDDEGIRDFVATVLADAGYAVRQACDGAEALALVDRQRPALILLDMRMPIMDGWRFAAAYRARRDHGAPLVCMTAAVDAAQRAEEIAAVATLAKPFDLEELLAVVGRYCSPGEPGGELIAPSSAPSPSYHRVRAACPGAPGRGRAQGGLAATRAAAATGVGPSHRPDRLAGVPQERDDAREHSVAEIGRMSEISRTMF